MSIRAKILSVLGNEHLAIKDLVDRIMLETVPSMVEPQLKLDQHHTAVNTVKAENDPPNVAENVTDTTTTTATPQSQPTHGQVRAKKPRTKTIPPDAKPHAKPLEGITKREIVAEIDIMVEEELLVKTFESAIGAVYATDKGKTWLSENS